MKQVFHFLSDLCYAGRGITLLFFNIIDSCMTHNLIQPAFFFISGNQGRTQTIFLSRKNCTFLLHIEKLITQMIRVEVVSSWLDHLPILSAAKTSELSLLVKSHFWWLSGRYRQCYSDFLLQCAGVIEADHTDSGIGMDCADRNRETPHFGDWRGELTTATITQIVCSYSIAK